MGQKIIKVQEGLAADFIMEHVLNDDGNPISGMAEWMDKSGTMQWISETSYSYDTHNTNNLPRRSPVD